MINWKRQDVQDWTQAEKDSLVRYFQILRRDVKMSLQGAWQAVLSEIEQTNWERFLAGE